MSRPVRRVALYGFLGSGNLGNDASFETVLGWLRAEHPELDLGCITIAPDAVAARYGVASVPLATELPGARRPGPLGLVVRVLGRVADVPRSLVVAGTADVLVVPGMGVLEDTLGSRPWGMPTWLALTAAACRLRGRRFVLLDVGAERAQSALTRGLFALTTRLAGHVSYRDQLSAREMAGTGARRPDAIAPDLAFAHPAPREADPVPGRLVVGVMAYYGRADDPVRGRAVRRRYVETLTETLAELLQEDHHVVLVGGDGVDVDVAHEVAASLRRALPDLPATAVVVREATTFTELSEEMARAEVVVASRFHNLICALRLGRPAVSVGYADKNRELMQAVGLGELCSDIESLDAPVLLAHVRTAQREAASLAARVRAGSAHYADEVRQLLDQVASQELGLAVAHDDHARLGSGPR